MVYRFHPFQADAAKGCLLRNGEEIPLRRKAFQVLLALLENRDRLVTKDELFAAVWPDTAVTDDVLAGVITELRKALADNPKSPLYIKTVPRVGYRFIASAEPVESAVEAPRPAPPEPPARPEPAAVELPAPARPRRIWKRLWPAAALATAGVGWLALQGTVGLNRHEDPDLHEVAWWRFDEASGNRVTDSSGNGNHGAIYGGVSRVAGKVGGALELDGSSGYVQGLDSARAMPSDIAARSMSAWIRTSSTNGDVTPLFIYGEPQVPRAYQGRQIASRFCVFLRMDGKLEQGGPIPGWGVTGTHQIDDGEWHHVASTWSGSLKTGEAHLYVDGRQEGSASVNASAIVPGSRWWIGGIPKGTLFRGQIDDVRIFNGALDSRQVSALYRCSSLATDLEIGGQPYYFIPIYDNGAEVLGRGEIRNPARDFGGVQFSKSAGGDCALETLRGTDVGQDVHISVDLFVPTDAAGHTTEAGPYFRSRRAAPGDGIIGGTSAGYSVVLYSSGSVVLHRLNPSAVVAFATIPDFDPAVFHHLEMAAVADKMQVSVDGRIILFEQESKQTDTPAIPAVWNGPPVVGYNRGTAGIAFSARQNRSAIGGQIAKGIRLERTSKLLR
jgi:DNA-binding winged helix-turn-helix (wHTH) protein